MNGPVQPDRAGGGSSIPWVRAGLLFTACLTIFWLYAPSLGHDFVYFDDNTNLFENPRIGVPTPERLVDLAGDTQTCMRVQPLSWILFSLMFGAFGLTPGWYHAANLVLHAGNTVLLTCLLWRLQGKRGHQPAGVIALLPALLVSLLWALHPLRVELVGWVSGIFYLQAFFWALLAMHAFQAGHEKALLGDRPALLRWSLLTLVLHLLSLLVYPVAIAWPLAAVAYVLWRGAQGDKLANGMRRGLFLLTSGLLLLSVSSALLNVWVRVVQNSHSKASTLDVLERIGQACYVVVNSLRLTLVPVGLTPVRDDLVEAQLGDLGILASLFLVMGVTILLCLRARSRPGPALLWLAYLAILFPHMGWFEQPHYPADRYSYFSGLVLVTGFFLLMRGRQSRGGWLLLSLLLALCFYCSRGVLPLWKDTASLYTHVVSHLRKESLSRVWKAAREDMLKVEQPLSPALPSGVATRAMRQSSLARDLTKQGRVGDAVVHLQEALRLEPDHVPYMHDLFLSLVLSERLEEAKCFYLTHGRQMAGGLELSQRRTLFSLLQASAVRLGKKSVESFAALELKQLEEGPVSP